ncbi:unnamed protein product [Commensalibacter communis]|uniref:hypothetical protein n=1 Tax=Commensalibacter communis TaxID=2972786 RepID=UPI0022FF7481|nr:hypothetical protein [Commensalibacter communis]CAI3941865.1 unnamed protein product [Commensalibacter communis]CAI3943186.1 unnamed protein product [Commensalibacter communis]
MLKELTIEEVAEVAGGYTSPYDPPSNPTSPYDPPYNPNPPSNPNSPNYGVGDYNPPTYSPTHYTCDNRPPLGWMPQLSDVFGPGWAG